MPARLRKPWTVLIYMVADDPQGGELLDQQAVREMDEITKATLVVNEGLAEPDQINVALQVDFRSLPGVWRRVVGKNTFVRPEGDAANPATLYGFFEWAADECPADHYLLIFWGHSRGQFGLFGDPDPFAYTAQTLTLDELGVAIKAAKRSLGRLVDIIAFKDCFMATLETAYELSGLASYLLASPTLVPIEGWPYEQMFKALADKADKDEPLPKAARLLEALRVHYKEPNNIKPYPEVPYSLLSTRGAVTVVEHLARLVGKDKLSKVPGDGKEFAKLLGQGAVKSGDPALADLGALAQMDAPKQEAAANSVVGAADDQKEFAAALQAFIQALGKAATRPDANAEIQPADASKPEGLVIDHTGASYGGVGVFVYPPSPKAARDSLLTRLADERAFRRLAISQDTNWADIAFQSMPLQPPRPSQDMSVAIGLLEQLERLGAGMGFGLAGSSSAYYRSLAQRARSGALTDADLAQASEYAAIAEIATRLAAFAAKKGTDGFGPKGTDGFAGKGTDGFAGKKGTDGFSSQ